MSDPFEGLPRNHFGAILADPPWAFQTWWSGRSNKLPSPKKKFSYASRATEPAYEVMRESELTALPVADLAAPDCVLFLWGCWPTLEVSLRVISAWGFKYKTCAFAWMKVGRTTGQPVAGLGYWSRSNTEFCLLATRGHPKRRSAGVAQAILEPRREHSRKPDGIHERIERLVAGPYLELFARQSTRPGWTFWGNETEKFHGQPEQNLASFIFS